MQHILFILWKVGGNCIRGMNWLVFVPVPTEFIRVTEQEYPTYVASFPAYLRIILLPPKSYW